MIGSKGVPDERESVELVQADPESLGAGVPGFGPGRST